MSNKWLTLHLLEPSVCKNNASSGLLGEPNFMPTDGNSWRQENSRPVHQYIQPRGYPAQLVIQPARMASGPPIVPSYQMAYPPIAFVPANLVDSNLSSPTIPTLASIVRRSSAVPIIDPNTRAQAPENRVASVSGRTAAVPDINSALDAHPAQLTAKSVMRKTSAIPIVNPAEVSRKQVTPARPISVYEIPNVSPLVTSSSFRSNVDGS